MHDFDESGERLTDKYTETEISTDYLNKYMISGFETVLRESAFDFEIGVAEIMD